jgi:hypothetical protein
MVALGEGAVSYERDTPAPGSWPSGRGLFLMSEVPLYLAIARGAIVKSNGSNALPFRYI